MSRHPRRELLLALLVSMALFALLRFRLEREADLGWHLAQGRLLAAGHWLRTNALAWTALDEPWVDTSWLFDWLTFESTRLFPELLGPKLVTAFLFALTLLFSGLAALEISPLGVWLLPALTLLLVPRATPRPHVASWTALACVLWLCLRANNLNQHSSLAHKPLASKSFVPKLLACQSSAQRWRLLALVPLWVGGLFHAGSAFAAAPLGFFCLEAAWRTRARTALLPALLAPLALLAGPSGPASIVHLLRHWNLGEIVVIQEFEPWTWHTEPFLPLVAVPALLGLFLAWRERPEAASPSTATISTHATSPNRAASLTGASSSSISRSGLLALLASALLFGLLALRTVRVFYEFLLVCPPALALLVESIRRRQGSRTAGLTLIFAALFCALGHGIPEMLGAIRFSPRWNEQELPVRAARFLDAHGIDGPGFNGLRDGGYLEWVRPSVPAFIDARIHAYPASLWHDLDRAEQSGASFDRFLLEKGAGWALTVRLSERLGGYRLLDDRPDWALVYWDETSALYLRRDQPRFAAPIESFEYKRFHPWGNIFAAVPKLAPADLAALDGEVARYRETAPDDPIALIVRCQSARVQSLPDALDRCREAVAAANNADDPRLSTIVKEVMTR